MGLLTEMDAGAHSGPLRVLDSVPEGLLEARVEDLYGLLGGPTLIHLAGRRSPGLFVSVLLHGNEGTGFQAAQGLLRHYRDRTLPRDLSLFIGNVAAAREGLRHLEGQPDYNRIWPGTDREPTAESAMMEAIVRDMERRGVFASVDVHNNTGLNPHYACVNRIDHRYLHLATIFSRTVVYFTRPRGVQSMAFGQLCPAVTVECGQPGQPHGIAHAQEYLEACLNLSEIPIHPVSPHDLDLFHTVAVVRVPDDVTFSFGERPADIEFVPDLDRMNFRELPAGTSLAYVNSPGARLEAWDEYGHDVGERFFKVADGELRTQRPLMPSMFTLDERIIRDDCLGYVMERYEIVASSE